MLAWTRWDSLPWPCASMSLLMVYPFQHPVDWLRFILPLTTVGKYSPLLTGSNPQTLLF